MVEHATVNRVVVGSSPTSGASFESGAFRNGRNLRSGSRSAKHLRQYPMTTATPPRRKWHLQRWLLLLAAGLLAYTGWTTYAFRTALAQAKALGWIAEYTDPSEEIRKNWKAAFRKATWLDGVTHVSIHTSEEFVQHLAIVRRLNPCGLQITIAATLRDLSALKDLTRLQGADLRVCTRLTNVDALTSLSALQWIMLDGCTGLTSVDGLKNLSALSSVSLIGCTGLTNVNALKNLYALQWVSLIGCAGLTNVDELKNLSNLQSVNLYYCKRLSEESVAELKAVLPNAEIIDP